MDTFDLLLCADELRRACLHRGLDHPRVAGLLASGRSLPPGAPMEVYVVVRQELTGSDLARMSGEVSELIGWPVVLWPALPGQENLLPGERVSAL